MTTKYIAYDGKEFDNPSNCKKYERYSLLKPYCTDTQN